MIRKQACQLLEIGKSRFSEIYKQYQKDPDKFDINYERHKVTRKVGSEIDEVIAIELRKEKEIIENPQINTVQNFNFYSLKDEIKRNYKIVIAANTIRNKAINWGFYKPGQREEKIYIEFEAGGFGVLWQHDTSTHKWSPYMPKFSLILTIDDHSRLIIYGKFIWSESSMAHIYALEESIFVHGIPLKYYVDRHSIFTGHTQNGNWNKR